MFTKYFEKLEKQILKNAKPPKKSGAKAGKSKSSGGTKSKKSTQSSDHKDLQEGLNQMLPSYLMLDSHKIIDPSGYSPEGIDFIAYKEFCRDIVTMMGGFIPCDLVYGMYHVASNLNKDGLNDALKRVMQAKKINRYTEGEIDATVIPAFVIAYDTNFKFPELKDFLIDYYMSKNIDHSFEVDIIAILGKGLVIKDWREKRSFIALETGKHTLMWFFILMSEYLDVEKGKDFDLRNYVKHGEKYNEY